MNTLRASSQGGLEHRTHKREFSNSRQVWAGSVTAMHAKLSLDYDSNGKPLKGVRSVETPAEQQSIRKFDSAVVILNV